MHKVTMGICCVLMTACLTPKVNDTDDDSGIDEGVYNTIYDIQSGAIEEGDTVTIQNAIIVSSLTSDEDGFFIQDEGGGEYSGIYVFIGQAGGDINPFVGDKITITGVTAEYYDSSQLVLSNAESMTVTGEGEVAATVVSNVTDWEVYEGVYVTLEDQEVLSDVNSYGEVAITEGIPMDNLFFNFDTEFGATYSSISGVVTYSFEEYKLCPTAESDLDGYSEGEGPETTTVSEVQSGDYEGRTVQLENIVVTEAESDFDGYSVFWVQDAGAGEWSGLYVFVRENTASEVSVSRGDIINLSGAIEERYEQTQLVLDDANDIELVSSGADTTTVVLTESPADWENYEGVLVTLENAVIGTGGQYGQYEISNFTGIKLDDELYQAGVAQNDEIAELTGLVYFSYGEFTILPRDAEDVGGTTEGPGDTPVDSTIVDCRNGTVAQGTTVTVDTGVVTAVSSTKVYIQDPNATEYAAIIVYFGSTPFTLNVGDLISVTGSLTEYYDVSQISVSAETDVSVTGSGTVNPTVLTTMPSDWEVYESMLVTVNSVTVTSGPDTNGNFETDWDVVLSDYWLSTLSDSISVNGVYSFTGIVNYYSGSYELLIDDPSDIVAE
jgi:predicted extracellular nuclease